MTSTDMQNVFPGGKRIQSIYKGFTVETDQPVNEGGAGTAPEPFDLFLSSIGTCAGVYVIYSFRLLLSRSYPMTLCEPPGSEHWTLTSTRASP